MPPWAHGRAPGPRFHSRVARAHAGGGRPPRHSPKGRRSLRPTKVDPGVKGGGPSPSIGTTGVLGGRGATPGGRRRRAEPPSRTPKSGGSPAHARGCGGARWRAREWQGARRRAPPDPLGCPRAELSLPECAPGRQRRRGSPALSPLTSLPRRRLSTPDLAAAKTFAGVKGPTRARLRRGRGRRREESS